MDKSFKRFSEGDRQFISENLKLTNKQIGAALGRSEASIAWQLQKIGLTRGLKKNWTETEIEELRIIAPGKSRKEIAAHFNLPENIIVAALKNRRISNGRNTRFTKGSIPANKGKKIPAELISEAMRASQFKKGNIPHNVMKDGDIITKNPCKGNPIPYKWIRIGAKKWELLHRYNYKKFIGPIPEKYFVIFSDGNTLNCEPSNLKLESIQEHMQRNTIHRYDPQLRSAIRLLAKFKRKIKQHEKQD